MKPTRQAFGRCALLFSLLICMAAPAKGQTLATVGDDFWLGFMNNTGSSNEELRIFITSQVATSGTVEIPMFGWSANFTVIPNVTTTVIVPLGFGETLSHDIVDTKGIHVYSNDDISLFAINFSVFSADASKILPTQSLGTDYLVSAYRGITNITRSEMLIVATEDNTEIEVTPSVQTQGGFPAGVPYTINLDQGECYQIRSNNTTQDLTGTRVTGTLQSGDCRPFAVFAGAQCANIPTTCTTCDHLFDQQFPTFVWGTEYYMPNFESTGVYTYRILAKDNGTQVSVDGGPLQNLNSGQFIEVNDEAQPRQITSNLPIQVVQYMQGDNCSLNGDPAMLILNAHDQKISNVTFSTVASAVITSHYLNIVVETADIGTVLLDNTPIPGPNFAPFPSNPATSFARIPVTQGSHNIFTPNGFTAYLYGMGTAESYAYSLGSYKEIQPIPVDTVICSDLALTLVPPISLFQPEWYAMSDTTQILSTSNSLALNNPPHITDIYVIDGVSPISGCPDSYSFSVASPGTVGLNLTVSDDTVCSFESVIAIVNVLDTGFYEYQWTPSYVFSNPNNDTTELVPFASGFYGVTVENVGGGCLVGMDSVYIHVEPSNIQSVNITVSDTLLCLPDTASLQAEVQEIVFIEEFNGTAISPLWSSTTGGTLNAVCGSLSGNAYLFNSGPTREIITQDFDLSGGGSVQFYLKVATGVAPCDDAELGEDIVLEYSTNGGATWQAWTTLFEFNYPSATLVDLPVPGGAQTANTRIRWSQPNFSAINEDVWWIDNVIVTSTSSGGVAYNWTPSANLTNPTGPSTDVIPTNSDWYVLEVGTGSCAYQDSVFIDISEPFTVDLIQDTLLCGNQSVDLQALVSSGTNQNYTWEPVGVFSNVSGNTATVSPNIDTTIYVTVTSPDGCFLELDSAVVVNQFATVDLTGNSVMCLGESQVLSVLVNTNAQNTSIEWYSGVNLLSSSSNTQSITPTSSGWYSVIVSDPNSGCSWSDSLFVSVSSFVVDAGPDVTLCSTIGYQMQGFANNGGLSTVTWTNGGALSDPNILNPTITQNITGSYILTVDNGICAFSDTVNITYNAPIVPYIPNDTTICENEAIIIDMEQSTGIAWSPNVGISTVGSIYTFQPIGSIDYIGIYTTVNGCPMVDTMEVSVLQLPQVFLIPDTTLCPGETIDITAFATPTGGNFQWNSMQTTPTITVNTSGMYAVDYTTICGVATDSVQIDYHPAYSFTLGNDTTVCLNDLVLLQPTLPQGGSIIWSDASTNNFYASSSAELIYATVDDGNGCLQSDSMEVFNHPTIQTNLPSSIQICDGSSATLNASSPQGVLYAWNTQESTATIDVNTGGTYTATITDAFGCSIQASTVVTILSLPSPVIQGPVDYCSNEETIFSVSGNYTQYQWSTGSVTPTTTILGVVNELSIIVTDNNGCQGVDTLVLSPIDVPILDLGEDISLCDSATITLDGTVAGASGYLWSPNGAISPSIDAVPGVYQLTVTYQTCEIRDTIIIAVEPYTLDLGEDRIICKDDDILVVQSMSNIDSLLWMDGTEGGWYILPTSNIFEDSIYISATAYGCDIQQDTLKVVLEDCDCDFYVPNTFTPNGDAINEAFQVYQDCPIQYFELILFNRWGDIVFETNDLNFAWDGKMKNGIFVQDGVYTWQIKFLVEYLDEAQYEELHGHLNVLR
ncbi:gliding motility-associated C-terminal domain-containing protein [Crocinitomicaceae bacterium]|nr:gliding motility-associated C-terminal domain-containing protein [Crocinitomicaceae bacterium]